MREGLDKTLTLQRLGVSGALYRTVHSTNPIENLNGSVAEYTRNVKRWPPTACGGPIRWVHSNRHAWQGFSLTDGRSTNRLAPPSAPAGRCDRIWTATGKVVVRPRPEFSFRLELDASGPRV